MPINRQPQKLVAVCLILALAGCGGNGNVSGKVTYKGEPLSAGHVTFISKDGQVSTGKIRQDGTYQVLSAVAGPSIITVDSRPPAAIKTSLNPADPPVSDPASGKYVPIPDRYRQAGKSGLRYTVTRGEQTYDIELVP